MESTSELPVNELNGFLDLSGGLPTCPPWRLVGNTEKPFPVYRREG